jgi:tetratricopeptide (TPR) repeat protein
MSPISDQDGPPIAKSTQTPPDSEESSIPGDTEPGANKRLSAARIFLLGKLASMPRREAKQVIRQQGGMVVELKPAEIGVLDTDNVNGQAEEREDGVGEDGRLASGLETDVTMVVVGDDVSPWQTLLQQQYPAVALGVNSGRIELLQESELWRRVGLLDLPEDVRRLYTPAMLAELLGVSVSAIRRWHRKKLLVACRHVRRLPYFDFAEVSVARHLADLHKAGCSLRMIDRKLRELAVMMPDYQRPLAELGVVVEGRRLFIRRGDDLEEPSGQRQFDFDRLAHEKSEATSAWREAIPLNAPGSSAKAFPPASESSLTTIDRLQQEAIGHEDRGSLDLATETYRAILMAGGPSSDINFALADILYRQGDHAAARERYYMAIEIDEEYVEARANLGCVLAEMGELKMAVAAFQGALAYHADYADAHYHLAGSLDRMERHQEAQIHWRTFLALAPESSWAEVARIRLADELAGVEEGQSVSPNEKTR